MMNTFTSAVYVGYHVNSIHQTDRQHLIKHEIKKNWTLTGFLAIYYVCLTSMTLITQSFYVVIGCVHKQNLGDLDQSRAISSGARPFVNYLRAIHSTFINSGAKQSDHSDLIQVKSATKVCLHLIRAKYGVDKSNAVIICSGKK